MELKHCYGEEILMVILALVGDISKWIHIWRWKASTQRFWSFLWLKLCSCTRWTKNTSMYCL